MRTSTILPSGDAPDLAIDRTGDGGLTTYLTNALTSAIGSRMPQETEWQDALRRYEGVPKSAMRDVPVENAPNVEVKVGATAADAIYAQFLDTIFTATPIVTARPVGDTDEDAKDAAALQRRLNHGCAGEWNLREAVETGGLDDVQLGACAWVIPWVRNERKTDIRRTVDQGSRIIPWPIEDVLVRGGACSDVQREPWIALRSWYTLDELNFKAAREGWDVAAFQTSGSQSYTRLRRETLGRTFRDVSETPVYEVWEVWCTYDYNGDGEDEDLYVVYNHAGTALGKVAYNPYDRRPIVVTRYQRRAHLFYGMGVVEMTRTEQETVSELMNQGLLNITLANMGVVAVKEGLFTGQEKLFIGKQIPCNDPTGDFVPKQLAQPYPTTPQYIAMVMSLAERRVGVNEMAMPRPSQVLGSRTPGITAMSLLQQYNRRFTPAFDQMRNGIAECVRHCLYREQERLLQGDQDLEAYYRRILGPEDAMRVVRLLRDPAFDEAVTIELTASSASVNREADRQNALSLVQILGTYYERVLQLVMMAANPQVPEPIRDVARQIAEKGGRIIERALTTFDSVRDPRTFILDVEGELEQLGQDATMQQGIGQILGMLGGPGAAPGPAGPGEGPPPPTEQAA